MAAAKQIIAAGGKVIIISRSQEKVSAAQQQLGENATGMAVDCSNENAVKEAFAQIEKNYTINHLVLLKKLLFMEIINIMMNQIGRKTQSTN